MGTPRTDAHVERRTIHGQLVIDRVDDPTTPDGTVEWVYIETRTASGHIDRALVTKRRIPPHGATPAPLVARKPTDRH